MFFFTCFWRFLTSNKLEQLEFILEKNIGIQKHPGKVRKILSLYSKAFSDFLVEEQLSTFPIQRLYLSAQALYMPTIHCYLSYTKISSGVFQQMAPLSSPRFFCVRFLLRMYCFSAKVKQLSTPLFYP